jgi:hypothetical protein
MDQFTEHHRLSQKLAWMMEHDHSAMHGITDHLHRLSSVESFVYYLDQNVDDARRLLPLFTVIGPSTELVAILRAGHVTHGQ